MRWISVIRPSSLRRLVVGNRPSSAHSSCLGETLIMTSATTVSYSSLAISDKPLLNYLTAPNIPTAAAIYHSSQHFNLCRNFSASSSSGPANVVVIDSEEQFNETIGKVQGESLPAIFYFTAVWCGPCKLLAPIIGQLSEKYPHVTTYKIDIDQEGLGSALNKLNIHSVPTLHFFQNGKKASEVIGADVQRLKETMEKLYK